MVAIGCVLILGSILVTVFNPLSAALLLRYEQVEARYLSGGGSLLVISSSGLWMRQIEEDKSKNISEYIINASRISQTDMTLSEVIIFVFDDNKEFAKRLDAKTAILRPGTLDLYNVTQSSPGLPPKPIVQVSMPTSLTMEYNRRLPHFG